MSSRHLIHALALFSLMWMLWLAAVLYIAHSSNLPDVPARAAAPMVNAAADTSSLAWQPAQVCVFRKIPRRVDRA